jgi:hypothetical protein
MDNRLNILHRKLRFTACTTESADEQYRKEQVICRLTMRLASVHACMHAFHLLVTKTFMRA